MRNRYDRFGRDLDRPVSRRRATSRVRRPARRAQPRAADARRAEMPRLHRGEDREACDVGQQAGGRGPRGPRRDSPRATSPRARDQYTEEQYERMDRELPDADLDASRSRRSMQRSPAARGPARGPRAVARTEDRIARLERRAYERGQDSMRDRGTQRGRGAAEDELMDMDLDAILEVDESEIEEGFGGGELSPGDDLASKLDDDKPGEPEGDLSPETVTEIAEEVAEEVVETLQQEGVIDKPAKGDKSGDKDDKPSAEAKGDKEDKPAKDDKQDDDKSEKDDKDEDDKKEASTQQATQQAGSEAVEPVVEASADDLSHGNEDDLSQASSAAKWAPLFTEQDVARLDRAAEVTLVPFLDQQDPSYSVLANGRPVGEIRESDLTEVDPQDRRAMFADPSFPKGIVQAASQLGVDKILGDLNLRYYANLVTANQATSAAKTAVQHDLEEAFHVRASTLKQDFINNVLLAVQASTKNVFVQNPLRDAVRKNFREAGVPDALVVDLFEDAVQTAGADYFLAMVNQADEWLGFEKEAMAQIESTINSAQYSHPVDRGMEVEADVHTAQPAGQLVAGAPPSMTRLPALAPQTMQPQPQRQATTQQPDQLVATDDQAMDAVKNVMRNTSSLLRGTRR